MTTADNPAPGVPGVYAAIAAVQADLAARGIAKAQTNQHDRYRFRGIDDVFNALGPTLARHGLVILPRVKEREVTERTSRNGGAMYYVVLRVEYDFVCAADGSMYTVETFGEAFDRSDKATPKAMAAAFKYAVFQAFCIPTEGTPDADLETHEPAAMAFISERQAAAIKTALEETESDAGAFCRHFGVRAVDALPADKVDEVRNLIQKKRAKIAASAAELNAALD